MPKILSAKCVGGVVTAGTPPLPLTDATVFSEGVAQSDGVVLLDEDVAFYLAKVTPDLASAIGSVSDALAQVKAALDKAVDGLNHAANALTTLDTKGFLIGATAGVPSPPVAAGDISAVTSAATNITSASTQISTIKTTLDTLKSALR